LAEKSVSEFCVEWQNPNQSVAVAIIFAGAQKTSHRFVTSLMTLGLTTFIWDA